MVGYFLKQTGGGIHSIAVMMKSFEESARMREKFAAGRHGGCHVREHWSRCGVLLCQ